MTSLLRGTIVFGLIFALAGVARPAELFVARNDPAADDKNPGTEAKPFKTIQAGVDAVKPGDTIWVKEGLYQDPVHIIKSGRPNAPITLSAWKDDRVRIGFPPEPLPVQSAWQAIPGSKCFQIKLAKDLPKDVVMILNGKPLLTRMKDTPPPDGKPLWVTYRKADRTLMFNSNGKAPSSLGSLEYSRLGDLTFFLDWVDWWIVRRLDFQWRRAGIAFITNNSTIEECFFEHIFISGIHLAGRTNVIRRCTFHQCGSSVIASGAGPANVITENLIVECGMRAEDDIRNDGTEAEPGFGPTNFKGANLGMVFAYNILADCVGGPGWYADMQARSCRIIGNAFWNSGGIYNEASVNDSLIIGNYFYQDGLASCSCVRLNVVDNFFYEGGVTWHCRDEWSVRNSYMLLRGNGFYNPKYGYLANFGRGYGRAPYPESFTNCMVDYNRIWIAPPKGDAVAGSKTLLINDGAGGKKYSNLEEIRQKFSWERHGEVLPSANQTAAQAVEAMGGSVATFRVPWGNAGEARPMLSAADTEFRWPAVADGDPTPCMPQFFWHVADGHDDMAPFRGPSSCLNTDSSYCWQPDS